MVVTFEDRDAKVFKLVTMMTANNALRYNKDVMSPIVMTPATKDVLSRILEKEINELAKELGVIKE